MEQTQSTLKIIREIQRTNITENSEKLIFFFFFCHFWVLGFRNTSSQISASISSNGKYVICASEDSHVYIWRYEESPQPAKPKQSPINITHSYENFHCHHVTVAATWPGSVTDKAAPLSETNEQRSSSATWPEEKLAPTGCSPVCLSPSAVSNGAVEVLRRSAWGLVIVTAARGGQIRVFQNFGFPVHV